MSKTNDGGPAFAHSGTPHSPEDNEGDGEAAQSGMSLRDWFAGQAANGLLASTAHPKFDQSKPVVCSNVAGYAYEIADAMLAARAK